MAAWLTSPWIDVAIFTGWFVLVIVIGVRVWHEGDSEQPVSSSRPTDAPPGLAMRLVAWLLVLLGAASQLRRGSHRD